MNLQENSVYTDLKYNCDLVVKEVSDTVVLLQDIESGNNRLCGIEEFSKEKKRFSKKE